ncbi:MAG: hypothetical protein IJ128_01950 [Firmicutes bacterium]|nr:hypothetical protein [Bacillota bacterium]
MKWNDTEGARDYASDLSNDVSDVDAHWWKFFSGYRLKQWKAELKKCMDKGGISVAELCEKTGLVYSNDTSFFARLPKKRETYIGIGMALDQSLDTINQWIGKYGKKRRLYAKDIAEDLVWIYLIEANIADPKHERNYYLMHEECADAVCRTYCALWQDYIEHDEGTAQILDQLKSVSFDDEFRGLTEFVAGHMDAFKTAYAQPRRMLDAYVKMILKAFGTGAHGDAQKLSVLRGYLDDSMINYLSGDPESIHALERRSQRHSIRFKQIPKGRKSHIALALALGMTVEIDQYLELMGFVPLDAVQQEEGILINILRKWEEEHPLQRKLKQMELESDQTIEMTEEEIRRAVTEMVHLRENVGAEFARLRKPCPYLK